jgi:chromate reductase, NAD(P)H dehydrogenase (quinone)
MAQPLHIFSFSGSLRQASTNTRLLRIIKSSMLPPDVTMEIYDLTPLPLYNPDLESGGFPDPVREFRYKIQQADAILIACPEYNYSVTSALKSAIDWASRKPQAGGETASDDAKHPLNGKPLGIVGGGSRAGTARAQLHLRQIASYLNMYAVNEPGVYINNIRQQFDENGELKDQDALKFMKQHVENLVELTRTLQGSPVTA